MAIAPYFRLIWLVGLLLSGDINTSLAQVRFPYSFCVVQSEENPKYYTKVNGALEAGCQVIQINRGIYNESFTLTEGRRVLGINPEEVTLTGTITLENNTTLQGITLNHGGVMVALDADVVISNVNITNSPGNGIETTGLGNLHLNASKITHALKKGIYIRWGKNIFIDDTVIESNTEEGIDIHGKTSGYIINSKIVSNGESGAEIVVSETNLVFSNNVFQNNHSHHVAFQYYAYIPQLGNIEMIDNSFDTIPKKSSITCKKSSGGNIENATEYWRKSIVLEGYYQFPEKEFIDEKCDGLSYKIVDRSIFDQKKISSLKASKMISFNEKDQQRRSIESDVKSRIQELLSVTVGLEKEWELLEKQLHNKPRWQKWIFGYSHLEKNQIRDQKKKFIELRLRTEELLQKTYAPDSRQQTTELYQTLSEHLSKIQKTSDDINKYTGWWPQ